jgi:hypothetical protein
MLLAHIFVFYFLFIYFESRRDALETNVRVKDNSGGEDRVHDGVEGAADEGSDGERNETGGDEAIPVSQLRLHIFVNISLHTAQRSSGSCHGWGSCGGQVQHRSLILVSCVV